MIVLDGVVSALDGFPVLAGMDLVVERGEVVVVAGPNGAGKTSLFRLVAGLLPVTAGRAVVLGADLGLDRRQHRRRLAYVGSDTFLYEDLGVRSNLVLHARMAGVSSERVDEVMALLGLESLGETAHGRLSTGQRRRCALALALLRDVDLLLLDEPYSGLDPGARRVVDDVIAESQRRGVTVLVATHDPDRDFLVGQRRIVVQDGCIIS